MFVVVVGGGKTGAQLASILLGEGQRVTIIEHRPDLLAALEHELPAATILCADGSTPQGLEAAGIDRAEVLAAVTGDDQTNLVVTTLGRFEFHVPRVIARVNNPRNGWLFTSEMGVDAALNQADLIARVIAEEMSLGDMMTRLKLRQGKFALVEERVHPHAVIVGKALRDIKLPPDCVLTVITRRGQVILPQGELVFEPLDEVQALVHSSQAAQLAALLSGA
jgi:trk system potassium uptake protein TrkA